MSGYTTIDGIVNQYRMHYPYKLIKDMDMPETVKVGAMLVGGLDIRYPGHGMSAVRKILEYSRPEYIWQQKPTDEISYAVNQVGRNLFNDRNFREQVLNAYESQAKPFIDRFRAYESDLWHLKTYLDPVISSMSDWKETAKIYKQYRQSGEMDRLLLLADIPLELVPVIESIDNMEKRYGDLIEQDLKGVSKSVYEQLGVKDAPLDSDKYGTLFSYLYMIKHLKSISDKNDFDNLI